MIHWHKSFSIKVMALFLAAIYLFVFHTEEVSWGAGGGAAGASAMAATQNLINASLPEAFQVDLFTGRAATGFPVALPPGRKSMQPTIALSYTNSRQNGWLGVGWQLDLGVIRREIKKGVPAYNDEDVYVIQFQGTQSPLVEVSPGQFRLENEGAFLKIEKQGSRWVVRDKQGKQFFFGSAAESRLETSGGTFSWHLDRVEDLYGNYLEITYTHAGMAIYPEACHYAGHAGTGLLPTNTVQFILEDRSDIVSSFTPGAEVQIKKRLKEIKVLSNEETVRRYVLDYHAGTETSRSLLDTITQFGAEGGSLPPVKFFYQETSETTYTVRQNDQSLGNDRWMVRTGSGDRFHNNESLLLPSGQFVGVFGTGAGNGATVSFGPSTDTLGESSNGVSWNQDGQGALYVNGGQDTHFHAFSFFFMDHDETFNFPTFTGHDQATGVFVNGNQQVWFGPPSGQPIHFKSGYNLLEFTGYNQNNGYQVNFDFNINDPAFAGIDFMNSFQFIQPQFIGDYNGDGVSDFAIYDQQLGEVAVSFSRSFAFLPDDVWITGFGNLESTPFLGDFNRDGKTDWGVFENGTWKIARSNGMDAFTAPQVWKTGFGSAGDRPFTGDFNGDSFIDVGIFKTSSGLWQVALSDGTQFLTPGTWISGFGNNQTPFTGDFNGDGLMDLLSVNESAGDWRVALGSGSTFTDRGIWRAGFGAGKDPIVADCNGDGLTDIGYFDTASGEVVTVLSNGFDAFETICNLGFQFTLSDAFFSFQPGDFTGDGLMDPAIFNRFTGQGQVAMSSGKIPDLLTAIDNGRGGRTELTYRSSASFMNMGNDEINDLPFVLPLIDTVTQHDGLGNAYRVSYAFRGGMFDFEDYEFRGFREVGVMDAAMNVSKNLFLQDDVYRGRLEKSWLEDGAGKRWSQSETEWNVREVTTGVRFVFPGAQTATTFDGNSSSRSKRTEYIYDDYGNVTEMTELGDVDAAGDERVTETVYEYQPESWLMALPETSRVKEGDGTLVSERSFEYDDAGSLRFERVWLHDPREPEDATIQTEFIYDAYGNIHQVKDPTEHVATTVYDEATHTYPVTAINALGHEEHFVYDMRFGELTSRTDANGDAHRIALDEFGRKIKIYNVGDSNDDPTGLITYNDAYLDSDGDGVGEMLPSVTQTVKDDSPGDGVFTSTSFMNGLGRTIQTRSESENPNVQVVSNVVTFDARGLPEKQFVPYFESYAETYVPPGAGTPLASLRFISFDYDAPGRRTKAIFPDGSSVRNSYDDWMERIMDGRGNPTERRFDGLGRVISVTEYIDGDDFTTTYRYDAGDRLLDVTDFSGHLTSIAYDSAGRKITLDDPDSGLTNYTYDLAGNLLTETDALGVVTHFTYDELHRPMTKSFSGTVPEGGSLGMTTYFYDGAEDPMTPPETRHAIGRLTQIVDEETTTIFDYDEEGRLLRAGRYIVELGAVNLLIERAYDRLGRDKTVKYPDSQIVSYTYNAAGGIETVALDGALLSDNFDYNAAGQLTRIDYTNGVSTGYFYDPDNLRLKHLITQENLLPNDMINNDMNSPLSYEPTVQTRQLMHYQFDFNGNITTLIDGLHITNANTQNFVYDSLNRLTRATGSSYGTMEYQYDPSGNLINKAGMAMQYGEEGAGPHALTAAMLPGGDMMEMDYDAAGNMIRQANKTMAYDQNHRLRSVVQPDNELRSVTYELEAGWNFISFSVLPPAIVGYAPDGTPIQEMASEKDILEVLESAGVTFGADITQVSRYDTASSSWKHFVDDPDYNEFSTFKYGTGYEVYCEHPLTFTVTGLLPQLEIVRPLSAGDQYIGFALDREVTPEALNAYYDFNGLITDFKRFNAATDTWESLNAGEFNTFKPGEAYIATVESAGTFRLPTQTRTSEYTYDSSGSRVKTRITGPDGSSTKFYLGEGLEIDVTNHTEKKSIFAGDLRLFTVALDIDTGETDIHFHHPDHLGSLNVTTDSEGAQTFLAHYTPFGLTSYTEGEPPTSFGFTDQEQDASGFIYMNARYYDPVCGRFLSPDPIIQDPFDPQFLNRYTYVRNNPLQFTDPSGLLSWKELFAPERAATSIFIQGLGQSGGNPWVYLFVILFNVIFNFGEYSNFFRNLFHPDPDNGYHGITPWEIIISTLLSPFTSLSGGVKAVTSSTQGIASADTTSTPSAIDFGGELGRLAQGEGSVSNFLKGLREASFNETFEFSGSEVAALANPLLQSFGIKPETVPLDKITKVLISNGEILIENSLAKLSFGVYSAEFQPLINLAIDPSGFGFSNVEGLSASLIGLDGRVESIALAVDGVSGALRKWKIKLPFKIKANIPNL